MMRSTIIPISFFPGTAGRLFSEFGFVLAFAVTLSAVVALTLVPMLASRWIGTGHHESTTVVGRAVSGFGSVTFSTTAKRSFCFAVRGSAGLPSSVK